MIKEWISYLLRPLLDQRGQMLGTFPYSGNAMAPGNEEETRSYERFLTSEPSSDYGDLIARYRSLLGGGAGSLESEQNRQREQGLELVRNAQAARGLGKRSGVGVSAAARYLGEFDPRAAAQRAEFMGKLMSDYGTAVGQGRKGYSLAQTKATAKKGPVQTTGGQKDSPFQYIPSNQSGFYSGSAPSGGGSRSSSPSNFSWFGNGGSSPYIPGGMEAAGYSQLGNSGAYSKSLGSFDGGFFNNDINAMISNDDLSDPWGNFTGNYQPTQDISAQGPTTGGGRGQLVGGGWVGQFGATTGSDDYWNRPGPWQNQF